jgi:hypothetical protein
MPVDFLQGVLGSNANKSFEPQRVNNALLRIFGLDDGQGGKEDTLVLALASFPLPKTNNNPIEVGYLNEKRKFAGNPVFDDLAVVFNDYVDQNTAAIIWKWRYKVYNPSTGHIGFASEYKKRGDITLYAPNGDEQYNRVYEIIGAWPSQVDPGEIDLAGEDVVKITITLTIDKAIPKTRLSPDANS